MAAESTDSGGSQQVASAVPPGRRPIRLRWVALVVAVAVLATGVGVAALHREPATATVTATHPPHLFGWSCARSAITGSP